MGAGGRNQVARLYKTGKRCSLLSSHRWETGTAREGWKSVLGINGVFDVDASLNLSTYQILARPELKSTLPTSGFPGFENASEKKTEANA